LKLEEIAKRILDLAREHNHPLAETLKGDVKGLALQLKEDLKQVQCMGRGGVLQAGNFEIRWLDAAHALLTIYDRLPDCKPGGKILETYQVSYDTVYEFKIGAILMRSRTPIDIRSECPAVVYSEGRPRCDAYGSSGPFVYLKQPCQIRDALQCPINKYPSVERSLFKLEELIEWLMKRDNLSEEGEA